MLVEQGEGIEAVRRDVDALLMGHCSDPYALETLWIGVLAFADSAKQAVPLPELTARGVPPRHGVRRSARPSRLIRVRREVRKHTSGTRDDRRKTPISGFVEVCSAAFARAASNSGGTVGVEGIRPVSDLRLWG